MIEFKAERSVFQEWWFIIFTNIHKTLKGLWLGLNYYYHIQTKEAYIYRFYSTHNCNSNLILFKKNQCIFIYKVNLLGTYVAILTPTSFTNSLCLFIIYTLFLHVWGDF